MTATWSEDRPNGLILPRPHIGQQIVRSQARRFNYLAAGRRWRKTTMFMAIAAEALMRPNGQYVWGAPTHSQVRVGWDELYHAAGHMAKFNQARMICQFPSGSRIAFRSLDEPDNARGFTADGIVVDECEDIKEIAWYEVLRPMLMDTNGWAWLGGTPKRRGWFWREHSRAKEAEDSMSWQIPTKGAEIIDGRLVRKPHPLENPDIKWSEIEHLFRSMTERAFRQEILAEFLEATGGVFKDYRKHADAIWREPYPGNFCIGIDWGERRDYTVISVFDMDTGYQVDAQRFNQIGYTMQQARVQSMCRKWRPLSAIGETNNMGRAMIEALQAHGVPLIGVETTSRTKPQMVKALALAIEKGELHFLPDDEQMFEMEAYEANETKSGNTTYSAPPGLHDDWCMANMLAYRAMNTQSIEGVDENLRRMFLNFTGR